MSKDIVIITGASSGIGKQTAIDLSKQGYPLLLLARRVDKMEELKLANTLCKKVDVLDKKSFANAIDEAKQKFGKSIGTIINNAGVMLLGNLEEQDENEWEKMINVNLIGLLNGIKLVIKEMIANQMGTIINVSSIAGRKTFSSLGVYCATKFAVHTLTESLREEVSDSNVRAITIAPGFVETELLDHSTNKQIVEDLIKTKERMGGALDPKVISDCISFALNQPQSVCIREIVVAPTKQKV